MYLTAESWPKQPVYQLISWPQWSRQQRLLACALCQVHADLLTHPALPVALQTIQLYADSRLPYKVMVRAREMAQSTTVLLVQQEAREQQCSHTEILNAASGGRVGRVSQWMVAEAIHDAGHRQAQRAVSKTLLGLTVPLMTSEATWLEAQERYREAVLDIVPNPFLHLEINPAWREWNDRAVVRLARDIYFNDHWDQMPILADALEEAGCSCPHLLGHLRNGKPHYLGCHVLDHFVWEK